ncbi:hypothetical protein ACHHYP_13400 [Achlya hypogyna]|uniref:Uncharacterized protein n=1 Tax=Achlya hypogyna TaxID=1202772 RepID=A0A1V9YF96_ACHHY|nr:hypothetical protein ACHHYP_13400 [Achlya hypogyna]
MIDSAEAMAATSCEDISEPNRERQAKKQRKAKAKTGASIVAGCRVKKTAERYNALNKHLVAWLKEHHAELVNDACVVLPLLADVACAYLWVVSIKCDKRGEQLIPRQFTSASHVGNASSALVYLRKEASKGYNRKIGSLEHDGDMAIQEGHQPITKQDHSLVVSFGKQKNDQEGKTCTPKHIYANPTNPFACPVLSLVQRSLAILVFSFGHREGSSRLPFGANPQARFTTWLHTLVKSDSDAAREMGISKGDIGTLSFRKGMATFVSSMPGGPQAVHVWLRAGWSLGSIQSRLRC